MKNNYGCSSLLSSLLSLIFVVVMILNGAWPSSATFECSQVVVSEIAPIDPNFSLNACIVKGNYTPIDCSTLPSVLINNTSIQYCGVDPTIIADPIDINGTQIFYSQLEQALAECPFDPVLIEFTGTLYLTNSTFIYPQNKSLIIQGISESVLIPGYNITETTIVNTTYFNTTTNATEIQIDIITNITGVVPDTYATIQSAIVPFKNFQVVNKTINVTLLNFISEGCYTEDGVFRIESCPESCGPDYTNYCPGDWFPKSLNVTDNGLCQKTGAYFDGSQRISFQVLNTTNNCNYNGYTSTDGDFFNFVGQFTVEMWINPANDEMPGWTGVAGNLRRAQNDHNGGYGFFYQNKGFLRWGIMKLNSNIAYCAQYITPLTWTHIAGVWNNGVGEFYINGILACNFTAGTNFPHYTTEGDRPFMIGASYYDSNGGSACDQILGFQGELDEVRVWNYARTSAQIENAYTNTISGLTSGLQVYMRFDNGPDFLVNSATASLAPPPHAFYRSYTPPIIPIFVVPDCFCTSLFPDCVPSTGLYDHAPGSVTVIGESDSIDNYEFIPSEIIDPNGPYGLIWLPGITNTTGPIYNQNIRFIPGLWLPVNDTTITYVFNNITNTTDPVVIQTGSTSDCFVPGTNPSLLPPLDNNPWLALDFFVPGWFFNDGHPPYSALNFVPGRFVPAALATVPTPPQWVTGDDIFEPGILYPDGTWSPFPPLNLYYILAITLNNGTVWRCSDYVDTCIIRNLTTIPDVPTTIPDLIDQYGCVVSPNDPIPQVLDPSQKDPCFILQTLVNSLPIVQNNIECNIGLNDPEPPVLDPTQRNPCFILRDLHTQIHVNNTLNCTNGRVPTPAIYSPCLKNQNLTLYGMTVQHYAGNHTICQWACEEYVTLTAIQNNFTSIYGNAIWSSGLQSYDVHDNYFCPCGGRTESCVYLNANHITEDDFILYNNRHCGIQDLLPYVCDYDLSAGLKCVEGQLYCLDIVSTLDVQCQQVTLATGITVFDSDCAIYAPCQCSNITYNITLPDGSIVQVTTQSGDVSIVIPFITPLTMDLLNGSDVLTLSCQVQTEIQDFIYTCYVNETVQMVVGNTTVNVTILVPQNCTSSQNVTVGTLNSLGCPCPLGWKPSNVSTNLTGAAAGAALGLYSTCQWDIPNGQPGEQCLNGIVQCPYAGGSLGSGTAPPAPVGTCQGGTAVLQCSDCVSGNITYEGKTYTCDPMCGIPVLNTTTNITTTVELFTVSCDCDNFALTVTCQRDISCIPALPCLNYTNVTLCGYTGNLTFDGVPYPCVVLENATDCVGISYASSNPTPPPDGFLRLPCDNSYQAPGPGPCSCQALATNNNITLPPCNYTIDPNCTQQTATIYTGDPALQLVCNSNGQITCRCDSIYSVNPLAGTNFTLVNNSAAFWIDHVPIHPRTWFQYANVAQQLPIGFRYTRFDYNTIVDFPLKTLHFFSDKAVMHESSRLSPYITGTVYDWANGYDTQWNVRYCNSYDPGPDEGVYDNECKQYHPSQNTSCVVDSTFTLETTSGFGINRFARIADAMALDACTVIIVHKAVNPYEEEIISTKDNVFLLSYDAAVIIGVPVQLRADYVTLRGLVLEHTGNNEFPLIQPTPIQDNNFDMAFVGDEGKLPPVNVSILNCWLLGHNVDKSGAVIGQFGSFFKFNYNIVQSFYARGFYANSDFMEVRLNTFLASPGRAFRAKEIMGITMEENLFIDCKGIKTARNVEVVSIRAAGTVGKTTKANIGVILYDNFTAEEYMDAFDYQTALSTLDPKTMGCMASYDPARQCYFRGNRMKITNEEDMPDYDMIAYRIVGGGWTPDRIRDNVVSHAKVGFDFTYTPYITYLDRDIIFAQNALIRTYDTFQRKSLDAADFSYRFVGSLVTVGCFFPNCWPNTSFPVMEANPRFELIISDRYGLEKINNLTDAARYSYPLNLVNVTSERAILRREQMVFTYDIYAVGWPDPFCCKKPIIYGASHQIATPNMILDNIEFRFEVLDLSITNVGQKLFETPARYLAEDVRFYNIDFDGRYTIGTGRTRITNIFMDPAIGIFVLDRSHIYNWWHYPEGTQRGLILNAKGPVPVVVLPDLETVYYAERSPIIDGIAVFFQENDRTRRSVYVRNTPKNAFIDIQSTAIITSNIFQDLDGSALVVSTPGSWNIVDNFFLNCGMRQPDATAVVTLEGNIDSEGSYIIENLYMNTTKPLLFAYGGGAGSRIPIAGIFLFGMKNPQQFIQRNVTIAVNGYGVFDVNGTSSDSATINTTGIKFGWFSGSGPKIFGIDGVSQNQKHPKPNTWNAEQIADRDVDPNHILSGTNADPSLYLPQDDGSFDDPIQSLTPLSGEDVIHFVDLNYNLTGYTVGEFIELPPQVMVKTLTPGVVNTSLMSFFQPQLYPYRIIATESGVDSTRVRANGGDIRLLRQGVGIWGLASDIVGACQRNHQFRFQYSFQLCIICNNGCPIELPTSCIVDPTNSSYVPENPYYGTWLFKTLAAALANCKDPNRVIEIVVQPTPYIEQWYLNYGNYTIISPTHAEVLVSIPVQILTDNLTISGIKFLHNTGDDAPTLTSVGSPINITIMNCTFKGFDTIQPAITGFYDSLSIVKTIFQRYESHPQPVVDIRSNCGILILQNNTFIDVIYSAVRAYDYNIISVIKNNMSNCGRLAPDATPYCMYVGLCKNTTEIVEWEFNIQTVTSYVHHVNKPRRAAYWIDGMPLANSTVAFNLQFNSAEGLDIGMRITNTDDLMLTSLFGDTRATVLYVDMTQRNIDLRGIWHYVVWGFPADDHLIDADPQGTEKYYCDYDCNSGSSRVSLVIAISVLVGFVMILFFACPFFCLRNPIDQKTYDSEVLGRKATIDLALVPPSYSNLADASK